MKRLRKLLRIHKNADSFGTIASILSCIQTKFEWKPKLTINYPDSSSCSRTVTRSFCLHICADCAHLLANPNAIVRINSIIRHSQMKMWPQNSSFGETIKKTSKITNTYMKKKCRWQKLNLWCVCVASGKSFFLFSSAKKMGELCWNLRW